jgi:hypothetical protein
MFSWKYRIKPFIIHTLRAPKYFIQRGRRGWSDQDAWNADMHLARVISGTMGYLIDKGYSIPMNYAYPDDNIDNMKNRMTEDYSRHIKVFQQYVELCGDIPDDELDNSLNWLKENFRNLWD